MRKTSACFAAIFLFITIFSTSGISQPPIPAGFYGSIKINTADAPAGTIVIPTINNIAYPASDTVDVAGSYGLLLVNGDDPSTQEIEGGKDGDEIIFNAVVNGQVYLLAPTGTWKSGLNQNLDLVSSGAIPVELASFTTKVFGNKVQIKWRTLSESDNFGFEIQRSKTEKDFQIIDFVRGQNTTAEPHAYSFTDSNLPPGSYSYRLRQIDLDGSSKFSPTRRVQITSPLVFKLLKNFPNPFNPTTQINYELAADVFVRITILNTAGQQVRLLAHGNQKRGIHHLHWDGRNDFSCPVSGGVYFCRMQSESATSTLKMILLR
ncbi:MAG: T9SS type A sorting domain-containing protein [Calditrichaeota bacterium]|nr:T9SS type A sorting domain-containing protein [Calditrichota bacterium]